MKWWFCYFAFFCSAVSASQTGYFFYQNTQRYELVPLEHISHTTTTVQAKLKPEGLLVRVRNQLVLLTHQVVQPETWPVEVRALISDLQLLHQYHSTYLYLVSSDNLADSLQLLALLQAMPATLMVQPDLLPFRESLINSSDGAQALRLPLHYNAEQFDMYSYAALEQFWDKSRGRGSAIAVIDDGFSFRHQALKGLKPVFSWDLDMDIPGAVADRLDGHGDRVAALIWAQGKKNIPPQNRIGLALGVAPEAQMIALKLQKAWTSHLLKAFLLAEQQQADVINISWLLPWVAAPVQDYLRYLVKHSHDGKGIVIVAAANPLDSANRGLAAMPELLVVTSTDHNGELANASSGDTVDLAAVSFVLSIDPLHLDQYNLMAKTSASAPLVAGILALARAIAPQFTAVELQRLLTSAATAKSVTGPDGMTRHYKVLNPQAFYQSLSVQKHK